MSDFAEHNQRSRLVSKCGCGVYHINLRGISLHLTPQDFVVLAREMFLQVAAEDQALFEEWTTQSDWQRLKTRLVSEQNRQARPPRKTPRFRGGKESD